MERAHPIQVGDIFEYGSSDECGYLASFYEVVRLKGKTMVELKRIESEYYLDERCREDENRCAVRPLAVQFCRSDSAEIVVAKVKWEPDSPQPWRTVTLKPRGERDWRCWMYLCLPEKMHYVTGIYSGFGRSEIQRRLKAQSPMNAKAGMQEI